MGPAVSGTRKAKLWGGRFRQDTAKSVLAFTSSLPFDRRLYREDIAGSIAHARMLAKQGIISSAEGEAIVNGLVALREEMDRGQFAFDPQLEDIHTAIELALAERIGEVAGKLHTGRSRNDQVALDLRLYVKGAIDQLTGLIQGLERALVGLAEAHVQTIMPGYTHTQRAQPVLLAHHLLAYFEMLERDRERLGDCRRRADVLPLGSGALAGTTFNIDRDFVARELGFGQVSRNSLDAVSDRDFIVEFLAAASLVMAHLSRLAEEVVLWSTPEFGFLTLDQAYATGSSIMPQKLNPDPAELVRGKAGRVFGHLVGMLATLKALPLSYNRDLQEDKEGLFDTVDTVQASLEVLAGLFSTVKVNASAMRQAAQEGYATATDAADYLARRGLPFRKAHEIVGQLVRYAEERGKALAELSLEEFRRFSALFGEDIHQALTVEASVAARDVYGGTAPGQVRARLEEAKRILGMSADGA